MLHRRTIQSLVITAVTPVAVGCGTNETTSLEAVESAHAAITISSVAEDAKLIASVTLGSQLGVSVALSDDTLLAGAHRDDAPGENTGAAFVFERVGGAWSSPVRLSVADSTECVLGQTVALDGDTAFVSAGAFNCGTRSGTVYVFERSGGAWSETQKLVASDAVPQGTFGFSLALQGDTAVVGATRTASAYVFVRSAGVWTEQAKLTSSSPATSFGWSVALDGEMVLVGAQQANGFAGSAHVFTRSGAIWTEQATLVSPGAGFPFFGTSVALHGGTALVSSGGPAVLDSGAVHVFVGSGSSWTSEATLTPSDGNIGDGFGTSLDLQSDVAIVGSPFDYDEVQDLSEAGSAYLFSRESAIWTEAFKLAPSDAAENDEFGTSVAMSGDTLALGAPNSLRAGAAYAFTFVTAPEDSDADGVLDDADACADTLPGEVVDGSGCSVAQLCPCEGPAGSDDEWKNHGKYVKCVRQAATAFRRAGLVTRQERREIVREAARSDCGRR